MMLMILDDLLSWLVVVLVPLSESARRSGCVCPLGDKVHTHTTYAADRKISPSTERDSPNQECMFCFVNVRQTQLGEEA